MTNHEDDLDLLLSLQDRVLETPPASPSTFRSRSPGYLSDDGSPKRRGQADMSMFKNAVQDCLDYRPEPVPKARMVNRTKTSNDPEVEKHSGLRIKNQLLTPTELGDHFSDIRFVRLSAIKNLLSGDTLSGSWATVGVLTEKGFPKTSSNGKMYCIWKIGCLDENVVSIFLFGDAYQNCNEQAGTVFGLFNCNVRKDNMGPGFSLSVYSRGQILKIGTSVDYGVCKGKKKDGMTCTLAINKRRGTYCKYHKSRASEKYSVTRTELKGGNLKTAFRDPLRSEGIYLVDPLADKTNVKKPMQPVKLLSVEALRKALSNAGKVTTNTHSQGIRFLTKMTGKTGSKNTDKELAVPNKNMTDSFKRKSSNIKVDPSVVKNQQPDAKRMKNVPGKALADNTSDAGKMIELDCVSSDDEI